MAIGESRISQHALQIGHFYGWDFLRGVAALEASRFLTSAAKQEFIQTHLQPPTVNYWSIYTEPFIMANYIHVPDEAPAVPKIDVTLDENDYRSGALRLIKELRPFWKPSEVKMKVLNLSHSTYSISNMFLR